MNPLVEVVAQVYFVRGGLGPFDSNLALGRRTRERIRRLLAEPAPDARLILEHRLIPNAPSNEAPSETSSDVPTSGGLSPTKGLGTQAQLMARYRRTSVQPVDGGGPVSFSAPPVYSVNTELSEQRTLMNLVYSKESVRPGKSKPDSWKPGIVAWRNRIANELHVTPWCVRRPPKPTWRPLSSLTAFSATASVGRWPPAWSINIM